MHRGNQDIDSPAELESQFLLRLPEVFLYKYPSSP